MTCALSCICSSHLIGGSGINDNAETKGFGGSQSIKPVRNQEDYFPGPFDRGRDHGFSKSEAYWDRDLMCAVVVSRWRGGGGSASGLVVVVDER